MKLTPPATVILALAVPAFAQTIYTTASYDNTYDNPFLPLTEVACSDGPSGLITKGYSTLGELSAFPRVGGGYTVASWGSSECGTCYQLAYNDASIYVLVVDHAKEGFNLSEEAMDMLTRGQSAQLGRIEVASTQVDPSNCGLN